MSGVEKVAKAVLGNVTGRCPKIDHNHDVPYTAGYSNSGGTIYVDRHVPKMLDVGGKKVDVMPFLELHEATEKAHMLKTGSDYQVAHKVATEAEHAAVRAAGFNPAEYEKALRPLIHGDEGEGGKDVPDDLDERPYKDEHDRPVLGRLARAGVR